MDTPDLEKPLWPLVAKKAFPRIHVLSDVHLETGPYVVPVDTFDILIAAGDIGPIEKAIPWLAALNKPVIYVLGNHEYYGAAFTEVVASARALAKGTQVHVLERNSIVLHGVRFLGTTLWASFGNWHRELVVEAFSRMNDYHYIQAGSWFENPRNFKALTRLCRKLDLHLPDIENKEKQTKFHPAIAYLEHKKSVAWLERQLAKCDHLPTVVVTHHAPVYESLRSIGVSDELLKPEMWSRRYRDDNLVRVANYASDLSELVLRHRNKLLFWAHGHLHAAEDIVVKGVRIVCNPRGHHEKPLSEDSARTFALFGLAITAEDIARSQAEYAEAPYRGNVQNFDGGLVLNLENGLEDPLRKVLEAPLDELRTLKADAEELLPFTAVDSSVPTHAVERCFGYTVDNFREIIAKVKKHLAAFDKYLDTPALRRVPGMPFTEPYPPMSIQFDDKPLEQTDYAKVVKLLDEWITWVESAPSLCRGQLERWAAQAARALRILSLKGLTAAVRAPAPHVFRTLHDGDLCIVVEADASTVEKLEVELDQIINGRGPRTYFIRTWAMDEEDWSKVRLLSLADLAQWEDNSLSLTPSLEDITSKRSSGW